jgi:integrase
MSFKEVLLKDFEDMLRLRSSLGYATSTDKNMLLEFLVFCGDNFPNSSAMTKEMLDEWLEFRDYSSNNTQAIFIALVRHYAKFIKFSGKKCYLPDDDYTIKRESYQPYIFNDLNLKTFFNAVDSIAPISERKREITLPVLFRMMYTCGMRPAEPLHLLIEDVNLDTGDIYIRKSKKNRERHIIMSEDMRMMCLKYNALIGEREYFFEHWDGGPIKTQLMTQQFHICLKRSGLRGRIRPYDLRHSFASRNIIRWIDEGIDIMTLLPFLSEYMGHANFKSTFYYIHLLPERLRQSTNIDWDKINILKEGELK